MKCKNAKGKRWSLVACIAVVLITQWGITLPVSFLWMKYIAFASSLFLLSAMLTQRRIRPIRNEQVRLWLRRIAFSILLLYDWLCLDTFLFGMRLPLSGMIRYGIFDFTLPMSPLFIMIGCLYGISAFTDDEGNT